MKTSHCNRCEKDLPEENYPFKDKASGRRHTKCSARNPYASEVFIYGIMALAIIATSLLL